MELKNQNGLLVSVVMPVYNGAPYLKESLESILNQTYTDFELVLVDDGSTDGSLEILTQYAAADSRIVLLRNQQNLGHAEASNIALGAARGQYIARQDQDDVALPERIREQVSFLENHPEVGLLGSAYYRVNGEGNRRLREIPQTHTSIRWRLLFDCAFAHSSVMLRSSLFQDGEPGYQGVGGPQDYELWTRLARKTRAASLPLPLVVYREPGEKNMTTAYADRMDQAVIAISSKQIRRLLPRHSFTDFQIRTLRNLRSPHSVKQDDLPMVRVMLELLAAFEKEPDIDATAVKEMRLRWIKRLLNAIPAKQWKELWDSGLLRSFVRYDPMILPKTFLLDLPRSALRQTKRAVSRRKQDETLPFLKNVQIVFNRPTLAGREIEYILDAAQSGHLSGDGMYTRKCQTLLEKELGVPKTLLTTSCTHALEMTALLLDLQPGDEVIIPSFTFVSTVNAFMLRGCKPVFADIRPDTLNIDENTVERLITAKTKAIVVVHYAGVGCEMDTIQKVARSHGVSVIEDNAHGLFGKYKRKFLGTFGSMATLSFHETKNFTCGEGGALLLNDESLVERSEIIREKGTNRSRFFRGQVDKYTWVDIGSSYLPSDILAAFLYAQLEAREQIQAKRKRIWNCYHEHLQEWAASHSARLPVIPPECDQPYHMFYLLMPSLEKRQALIAHLKSRGILSVFHYLSLHLSEMGQRLGGKQGDCPVTEDISDRLIRLPFHNDLSETEQLIIIKAISEFK